MSRSSECQCVAGSFTCGYCLRNAKPWHYTLSDGSAIVGSGPVDLSATRSFKYDPSAASSLSRMEDAQ